MDQKTAVTDLSGRPSFAELFTPKLVTILKEGYGAREFRADAIAGLTVAIVALPLSMAIAIASGATPAQGLYTAIIGGFLVSALGGSRFQVGGPAGAFIVLVAGTIHAHGMDGFLLAAMMSGLMLMVMGIFRLGTYIKFIPYPVTVGFTAGIAAIIFSSQIKGLFGLTLDGPEPIEIVDKLGALVAALPTFSTAAVLLSAATVAVIVVFRRFVPRGPGMLVAVVLAGFAVALFDLPVSTIGTTFGGIPGDIPLPAMPDVSWSKVATMLPSAISFALLGSIESLLSAVVADSMTGRRHRSNCELVAQGVANVASGLFGGICVTGTIARTATNVRAGAHGPVAGMMHSVFLLLFILVAAPLASYVPLACLAGILAVVSWNMVEKHAFVTIIRASRGEAAVLMATLLLTVFRDLTEAIIVGFALGSLIFIHRMSKAAAIENHHPFVSDDRADNATDRSLLYDEERARDPKVVVYRISGAFFFGAAASIGSVLERISDTYRVLVIDFQAVPFLDSTAAQILLALLRKSQQNGVVVLFTGVSDALGREMEANGIKAPLVGFEDSIETGLEKADLLLQRGSNTESGLAPVMRPDPARN